ncbi:MAG TPA: hydrogenase iron-sulfur subunit [Candidatus Lokiarchaeia archaeon]|nr:hydrogenase iron-sulfur subunit [Candidatus Lokiarchaeia archaeon]
MENVVSHDVKQIWTPRILGIFCNWCSYTGADGAGTARMQRPPVLRILRVMCSGRVEPEMVFRALKNGADGVIVSTCHAGDCHYIQGNFKTFRKASLITRFLEQMGVNPKRFVLANISASEGAELTKLINEYTEELLEIGPNPLNCKDNLSFKTIDEKEG